jgi:hypothetical protein
LPTFSFYPHLMVSNYTSWYQFPPTKIESKTSSFPRISLNSPLTHVVPNHKYPSPRVLESFKNINIPYQQSLSPLNKGQKSKFWPEIFKVDARVAYVIVVKISDFFNFFWNLCGISKVAFVECEWLIFKPHFGLDNDLCWFELQ